MAKRKPPSQRPERKLDEVAKAIAEARERTPTEKTQAAERESSAGPRQFAGRGGPGNGGHTPAGEALAVALDEEAEEAERLTPSPLFFTRSQTRNRLQ